MCHLHHPTAWSHGGGTNRDALMLCPRHDTLAHHPGYRTTHHPGGKVGFHRRPWADPAAEWLSQRAGDGR